MIVVTRVPTVVQQEVRTTTEIPYHQDTLNDYQDNSVSTKLLMLQILSALKIGQEKDEKMYELLQYTLENEKKLQIDNIPHFGTMQITQTSEPSLANDVMPKDQVDTFWGTFSSLQEELKNCKEENKMLRIQRTQLLINNTRLEVELIQRLEQLHHFVNFIQTLETQMADKRTQLKEAQKKYVQDLVTIGALEINLKNKNDELIVLEKKNMRLLEEKDNFFSNITLSLSEVLQKVIHLEGVKSSLKEEIRDPEEQQPESEFENEQVENGADRSSNEAQEDKFKDLIKKYNGNLELALSESCMNGDLPSIKLLLEHGANVSVPDRSYFPLHWATYYGKVNAVNLLLDYGADVEARTSNWNATALHVAAYEGRLEVLRLLLNRGAEIDALNKVDNTPLHDAAGMGHLPEAKLLVQSGASVTLRNKDGYTPQEYAAAYHQEVTSQWLGEEEITSYEQE